MDRDLTPRERLQQPTFGPLAGQTNVADCDHCDRWRHPHPLHTPSTSGVVRVHGCGKDSVHTLADMWITPGPAHTSSKAPSMTTHVSFRGLTAHDRSRPCLVFSEFILNVICESSLGVSPGVDKAVENQHDGTPGQDLPVRQFHTTLSSSTQGPGRRRSGCSHRVHQPCRSGVRRARRRQHQMALSP
mgnify:FL=1